MDVYVLKNSYIHATQEFVLFVSSSLDKENFWKFCEFFLLGVCDFFLYFRQAWVLKNLSPLQTRMGFGSFFLGGGASTTCLFSQTHFLHRVFLLRANFSCFYITTMMMKTMVTNTLMIMKMMVISMIETTMVMVMIMMMELVGRCSKA